MEGMPSRRTTSSPARSALLALVLVLPLAACSSEDPEPAGARPVTVDPELPSVSDSVSQEGVPKLVNLILVDGSISGVPEVVLVQKNVPVRLTVTSDEAGVLVVQGYEARVQLTADQPVQLSFIASREGDFPVQIEGGRTLTTLRVG